MTDTKVLPFSDPACRIVQVVGGKGASLAALAAVGLNVPPGFVIPSGVLVASLDVERLRELARSGDWEGAQGLVRAAAAPREEIEKAYADLGGRVAVRSSACAEDSQEASYAGQQETFLNVEGADAVCSRVVDCWASFFSERALFYRKCKGSLDDVGMAVVVQKMVQPDKSGVLFTADPVQRRHDRMIVESVFGLGEKVVSGEITPDHYVLDQDGSVVRERIVDTRVLTDAELLELVRVGNELERHFGAPQDIEWAIKGSTLYLLQCRPVTTL